MAMYFAQSLKGLRRDKNITQEALALAVGVTAQAVSKWERGENYPDLTLIPVLASFFGVSTDTLLGMDKAKDEEKIAQLIRAYDAAFRGGCPAECVELTRPAVKEFPGNYRLKMLLAEALCVSSEKTGEAAALCETVLESCTDDNLRMKAKNRLLHLALESGDAEKARSLAETMPDVTDTRQWARTLWSDTVYTGEERVRAAKENIVEWAQDLSSFMTRTIPGVDALCAPDGGAQPLEALKAAVACYQTKIDLYRLIYPDGDYGANARDLCYSYGRAGVHCAQLGDTERCLMYLEKAASLAVYFDALPDHFTYTSPLIRGLVCDMTRLRRRKPESLCAEVFRCYFVNERLDDGIKNLPRFQELLSALEGNIA